MTRPEAAPGTRAPLGPMLASTPCKAMARSVVTKASRLTSCGHWAVIRREQRPSKARAVKEGETMLA
jgi:hypothetical protein